MRPREWLRLPLDLWDRRTLEDHKPLPVLVDGRAVAWVCYTCSSISRLVAAPCATYTRVTEARERRQRRGETDQ